MDPPFEFNNLLGPLLALNFFLMASTFATVLMIAKVYYKREEESYQD